MRAGPTPIRASIRSLLLVGLCVAGLMAGEAVPARAERLLISQGAVNAKGTPEGTIEGPCGVAFGGGKIYVSDYYHHAVDVFNSSGAYLSRISGDPTNGPCQLATSTAGTLYANDWHESVSRLFPSSLAFDAERESTGVAVDQSSGKVYVDDRSFVAVYEPSGAPVLDGSGEPLKIGLGSLGDGYGLAVDAGRVYVPDAVDDTVKVFEPATDPFDPIAVVDGAATPKGHFVSLVDAAVAIDPASGHLLVVDNLQPGFEHPEAAIEEFDSSGAFLGQVAQKLIDGEPSGLAFNEGQLYATSGNSEEGSVFEFGAYTVPPILPSLPPAAQQPVPAAAQSGVSAPSGPEVPTPALRQARGGRHLHRRSGKRALAGAKVSRLSARARRGEAR